MRHFQPDSFHLSLIPSQLVYGTLDSVDIIFRLVAEVYESPPSFILFSENQQLRVNLKFWFINLIKTSWFNFVSALKPSLVCKMYCIYHVPLFYHIGIKSSADLGVYSLSVLSLLLDSCPVVAFSLAESDLLKNKLGKNYFAPWYSLACSFRLLLTKGGVCFIPFQFKYKN